MEQLTQLLHVDLSNNKFTGQVPSFKTSKNLTDMILAHNSFSGRIPPSHWEGLNKLVFLDLQNNLLSGNIHSSLFTLPLLEVVLLSNNQFKGQLPEFQNVSSPLGTLDLSSNNLEGPIPKSIYKLKNLSVLLLSSNKLNGTIQLDQVQGFRNLTTLDLSYNNLTVTANGDERTWPFFPKISTLKLASCKLTAFPNLRNHSKLINLDLSDNQICEEVPKWIWELGNGLLQYLNLSHNNLVGMEEPYSIPTFLSVLDLHSNQLQGKFPNPLSLASYIDFSSNNFTSSIPADIGDYLNYTIYFSISNNSLTSDIPESICNAGYLEVLDLSYIGLSSTIPRCVLGMSQTLGVLNLRGKKFSGQIRDVFPVNCVLETLDLNGNLIQRKIPKSLSNCWRLEVLDLGNNMLTGHFPCLLNNISTLRVLVMRSNRFQGNLGCPNTTGFWENLQIIDLARNNFNGKIGRQFLTRWKAMRHDDDDAQKKIKHLQFAYLELSPSRYYGDAVTVTFKGLEMKLQKILTLFNSIDLSCNNFSGPIPEEVGQLRALYILNLSHNALTGEIPPSTGNLRHLESLDLSSNFLSGVIPETLATLNFLSFLNLSFNHLVGRIPSGSQFQTFSNHSYAGNEALCGFPLAAKCGNAEKSTNNIETNSSLGIDWNIISFETGFIFGLGGVVLPLLLCRQRYYQRVDDIAFMTFPRIYQWFM